VQESPASTGSGNAAASSNASKPDAAKLDAIIAALDHKLPPIVTLAPKRDDALANLLKQAEEDMAAGKYFSAEQRYRSALSLSPNAPLAQVGLLHAQLGAGLTRSASLNLRQLLEEHPELIATRYDAKLLPSAERIKAAQSEIDSLIATTGRPEPAILLAYLGYQFATPSLTEYGLTLAQTRAPNDPLIPLLQRLWHTPASNPAPGSNPAPAKNAGGASEPRK
jgi:predicted Zn-dependent protease